MWRKWISQTMILFKYLIPALGEPYLFFFFEHHLSFFIVKTYFIYDIGHYRFFYFRKKISCYILFINFIILSFDLWFCREYQSSFILLIFEAAYFIAYQTSPTNFEVYIIFTVVLAFVDLILYYDLYHKNICYYN